jgi:pimeloyl-ACP methyl ester carboxylesterase
VVRAAINDLTLTYAVAGAGEPVVCIHGAFVADAFQPLVAEPSLAARYRLITYHRRGYGGSDPASGPVTLARQAADCRALLAHLGVARAHVVGHSFGGCVALQLALDTPEVVHSLVLLEPALAVGASAATYRASLAQARQRYRAVGAEVAVNEFLQARWPGYRAGLDTIVPGALAQAVADAGTAFEVDLGGLLEWRFGAVEPRQITQPVLSVLGSESEALWPRLGEVHRQLLTRLPHVDGFVLPGATHFLQIEDPPAMAEALATFFARHPLPVRSRAGRKDVASSASAR